MVVIATSRLIHIDNVPDFVIFLTLYSAFDMTFHWNMVTVRLNDTSHAYSKLHTSH